MTDTLRTYNFTVQPGLVQQGCLSCARVFRVGMAHVLVEHEGKTSILGSFEPVRCPACGEDKTDKAPAMFDSVDEAVAFLVPFTKRVNTQDTNATFRLLDASPIGIGSDTLQ